MNIYRADLEYYDNETDKIESIFSFTIGETYKDAVDNIISFYGEDTIESFKITFVSDYPVIEVSSCNVAEDIVKRSSM